MKHVFTLILIVLSLCGISQVTIDTSIKLDLLKSPASPAFNILGIATSDIERPTDLTSFALSLQEASNNFSGIPKSYAVEIAPFLLGRRKPTLKEFKDNTNAFKQSFLLSAGFTHMGPEGKEDVDSLKTTKFGFGIKFSIIRPKWSDATEKSYENLIAAQKLLMANYQSMEKENEKYQQLQLLREERRALNLKKVKTKADTARIDTLRVHMDILEQSINSYINQQLSASATSFELTKKAANEMKNERKGFFLDFSGGFAYDFPDNTIGNGKLYRGGAWITGGNENGNRGVTSMFIARYLYNPESIFADPNGILKEDNVSAFDAGARLLFSAKARFTFSGEALYRSVLGNHDIDPSWRLVFNTEYDVGFNKKLTFSFGRDFDGTISKGGNLVAALNLIMGSERTAQ
jgi:hypothetical protein